MISASTQSAVPKLKYASSRVHRALLFCLLVAGIVSGAHCKNIAIVGADVLPMTGHAMLPDQTVLISGDRIMAVGPRRSIALPPGFRVVDAAGKTLLPGLVDMHVHLANELGQPGDPAQRALAVMLAHGITTARVMAGAPKHPTLRMAIERSDVAGPRLVIAAPGINVDNARTAEAARASVMAAKRAGFDLIKSHHLTDVAIWQAVQDEARRQNLPVAGHVTNEVGLDRALAARQQVEHLDGTILALIPKDSPLRAIDFGQVPPPDIIRAAARASEADLKALAERVAAAGNYQTPTLALFEELLNFDVATEALRAKPDMRYVSDAALAAWAEQREGLRNAGFKSEDVATFLDLRRRIVRALHAAGAPLMTGSDTPQAFHIWGPGLIEEIEALAAAGLPPLDALRTATVVPRNYLRSLPRGGASLGQWPDFGTVEVGALADLILVSGNPLQDLSILRRPQLVIARGNLHDRASLDLLLEHAATDARKPVPATPASGR